MVQRIILLAMMFGSLRASAQRTEIYVGTYTGDTGSQGIYRYMVDFETQKVDLIDSIETESPSFIARSGDVLFAVNELGGGQGTVSMFKKEGESFVLSDQQSSSGDDPCHVVISPKGNFLTVSNYSGGSWSRYLFDSGSTGRLEGRQVQRYKGQGTNPDRQEKPHIHAAFYSGEGQLFVADLGTDHIYIYDEDPSSGRVTLVDSIRTPDGSGPRHLAFHPSLPLLYSLFELTGEIGVYERVEGAWKLQSVLPIYEEGFDGEQGAADIKVSPDGRHVYATNRGDANVICWYTIQPSGMLEYSGASSALGKGPRNFNITSDGQHVLVANQNSDAIVVFQRDTASGALTPTDIKVKVPSPVCVIF